MTAKKCFMNSERPCDLTCKAAFEVDDPVDNVDCYFIWLAYHLGEGFFDLRRAFDGGLGPSGAGGTPGSGPLGPLGGPKAPKGFSNN